MRSSVYSRWDGSQESFTLDAERAFDAMSELMMEGLTAQEALEWMRQHGFELAGLDMRVMGADELAAELRAEAQSLYDQYDMDGATDGLAQRLEDVLEREQRALEGAHGFESARMNDFLARRHEEGGSLADAIERFRDWRFEDDDAGLDHRELLDELDRLRELERFLAERGERFRGQERADYETAQRVREQIQALEQLASDLAEGNLQGISPEDLRELLGEQAERSLILLRDLQSSLERAGYLRGGEDTTLTPRAIRRIGAQSLAEVYGALRKDRAGEHENDARGEAIVRPDQTRPYVFGEPLDLDIVRTVLSSVRRNGPGLPIQLSVDDFEVREFDLATRSTTVLLLDMSW